MMKKPAQTILANVRRGFSSIASSPVSSRAKHVWKEQNKFVLGLTFVGGWFCKSVINAYKRREHSIRVNKFLDDEQNRLREEIYRIRNKGKKNDD